ncbi:Tub-domain-containing protein [Linderina pennispora]|uniref:Tub-domain-containing protein n=1 Tax=Linderina pennispora TaxID=61395 RepID=A0A1Y1WCW3_9FUNG|nr:Tub-domain-containing protein [Linderina pennispora]ORX70984.1 Tub-domain-containing protein [Linderina pennispora]
MAELATRQAAFLRKAVPIGSTYFELFDEGPEGLVNGPGDTLGGQVMCAYKYKSLSKAYYNMHLPAAPGGEASHGHRGKLIGRVASNLKGTAFSIMERVNIDNWDIPEEQIEWREVCCVLYETNILGQRGPRKMTILLRAVDEHGTAIEPLKESVPLVDRHKAGLDENLAVLCNRAPKWNPETSSFILEFGGRVRESSVKNFQLVHPEDEDYVVMQFGRVGPDSFTLDMRFPTTPVMALGIAITSLDRKLACS